MNAKKESKAYATFEDLEVYEVAREFRRSVREASSIYEVTEDDLTNLELTDHE